MKLVPYQSLFIRAKNVLKTRYSIELNDDSIWDTISSWLTIQLSQQLNVDLVDNKIDLKPHLETLRRKQPTKFYLLEQDLIKHIREEYKKEQKPIIRESKVIEEIDLNKLTKDDTDDDFESSDASGFIYS